MRKLIVSEIVSLDGVMQDPAWSAPYIGEEQLQFKMDEMGNCGGFLLGRVTYQEFAEAWHSITDVIAGLPDGFSNYMNSLPKFVVSATLQAPLTWNATLLKGDIVEAVVSLKKQDGKDIVVYGSSDLVQLLIQLNLVDEYRLLVYPVVVGVGKRLFQDGSATKLKLVEAKPFKTGIAYLIYHTDKDMS